ncbi:hypothetical protein HAZT_HAZT010463 [Hyalella azteca]|uniref:Sodium/hydrogen exchanger 8 n=1 Tax=Hyalella azteca TaxID=294128 RepID=A0A6A0HBC8_HYAAZ|nr:hypothetical protein HAZT_HAZT010463 [Hyalella azteca]
MSFYQELKLKIKQLFLRILPRNEFIGNLTDSCNESEDLPAVGAAEKEHLSSLSIFLILCILGLCVLLIFFMLKTKLHYLPESVACVIVGAFIGLVLKILSSQNIANFQKEEAFSPTIFFLVFLPPIIFESGYNLHKGNFFQNIGSILVFAILGTIVSALVIGGGIYLLGKADVVYQLTFVESFAFGSLISAVDPVATLALFNALQVDPILYMLVFGESILNDAVAIVLTTSVYGLRGAIAYALSLHLEFSDEKRRVLVTTALFIVLFTIFILGGSVVPLIKYVEVDAKKSIKKVRKKKTLTLSKTREWGQAVDSEHMSEMTEEESSEGPRVAILNGHQQLGGFLKLDKEYLRPFFCRNLTHQEASLSYYSKLPSVRSHAIDLKRQCYQSLNVVPSDSEDEMINI